MITSNLLPFSKVKDIINNISEEQIVQFDGAVCSQFVQHGTNVNIVELKIGFTPSKNSSEVVDGKSDKGN